jgi:hypothetical protein
MLLPARTHIAYELSTHSVYPPESRDHTRVDQRERYQERDDGQSMVGRKQHGLAVLIRV